MADAQELHQIEYRHHQTKDLSPVTSSMSAQSVRQWDARIRAWVRHPHADTLSESVCYQVFPQGKAALAWRYRDWRAAERADGTRGRPLVSRVLVGPAHVLGPELAVALCKAGPRADFVGSMPGDIPDGAGLPIIDGGALNAMTDAMAEVLDLDAARQAGLQAVVAAALADHLTPLAVSVEPDLIQQPLREGVQYPLLWGLLRIVGPVLGPVGRGWSFSTFEPPLGDMDPASLPGTVFRQAQDGVQPAPSRWRKEVKVRPLSRTALDPGSPYAGFVEMAGWLVATYKERGGDGLAQLIAGCCGSERSVQPRLARIYKELRKTESPLIISREPTMFVSLAAERAPAPEEPESAESGGSGGPGGPARPGGEGGERDPAMTADAAPTLTSGPSPAEAADAAKAAEWESTAASVASGGFAPSTRPGEVHSPATRDVSALASSKAGQQAPHLPESLRGRRQAGGQDTAPSGGWFVPPREPESASKLLKQLELAGDDPEQFAAILQKIQQTGSQPIDSNDRVRSWEVISHYDWYDNISKVRQFYPGELAGIFGLVVLPELVEPYAPEVLYAPAEIARWARTAQPPMISGLLAAAKPSPDTWQVVMRILEPVLAARWAAENMLADQWDADRAPRLADEPGHDDSRRGRFGLRRRH